MPRRRKEELFLNYVRVRKPDMERLAELTRKAIGENRSLSEFSRECGLSPSTVSRIINCGFNTAISDSTIFAIAQHADPASGVFLDDFLAAHGLLEAGYTIGTIRTTASPITLDNRKINRGIELPPPDLKTARSVIQTYLLDSGYSISLCEEIQIGRPPWSLKAALSLETNAVSSLRLSKWAFFLDDVDSTLDEYVLHIFSLLYLNSTVGFDAKISIVTNDRAGFNSIMRTFSDAYVFDCFSVLLFDSKVTKVVKEFELPWSRNIQL